MKQCKIISLLTVLAMIFSVFPMCGVLNASAENGKEVTKNGITYTIYESSGYAIIKKIDSITSSLSIPSKISKSDDIWKINGYPVKGISDKGFYLNTKIEEIEISDDVLIIFGGLFSGAFAGCNKLKKVTIPKGTTEIGQNAFLACSSLESVYIYNPDCEIYDEDKVGYGKTFCNGTKDDNHIFFSGTIYGYRNSTAQKYAEKYGYNFADIDTKEVIVTSAATTTSKTTTTTTTTTSKTTTTTTSTKLTTSAVTDVSGNIKIQPVYEDFNENDVNGAVEIALPEGITARVIVTFDSAEGKSLPYYDAIIRGGSIYVFSIEGTLESDDRLYTLSILPVSEEGFEAAADYTEQFSVKDADNFPDSFITYRYDIKYNYDFEGESWKITGGEDGNKEITFSFSKYAMGDVDMDGKITAFDAASVLTEYTELAAGRESSLNANQRLVADVDDDGKITAFDAAKILTYYTELAAGREPSWD